MCGIIGAWGEEYALEVAPGITVLRHRGPDDSGSYRDDVLPLALGFVRLSILDLSQAGHQPMISAGEEAVLVFNGEIYNFRELRAELAAQGVSFKGESDSEVLLALYLRDGEAMLSRLNGIFAFAIWDRRRSELFVARDALGVKPLYFSDSPRGFAFASEIKAMLFAADSEAVDAAALHSYQTFLWCAGEGTPFQSIRKLGPGEALTVRNGRVARRWSWYQLPVFRAAFERTPPSSPIAATAAALRTAVHRQLVADVPVGAFLSGGLDSSAIVAMARERIPRLQCFTIESVGGAEGGMSDDLRYARRVARHLDVPLEVVRIDSSGMAADLEMMVHQLDEPLADPAALNVLYISKLARSHGIKVLLSGTGGDDLFTGYRRHLALTTERYWSWTPRALREELEALSRGLDRRKPLQRRVAKLLSGAALDGDARLANYFVWAGERELRALYTPEFRAAVGPQPAVEPLLEFLRAIPDSASRLERLLALEQRFFLADHNLTYMDKMSMAVGVEVRVPFLDLDLVELAAKIPARLKQRGRHGKWVLKKAMEPFLPRDVIYRPKAGFGAPLRRWMRHELRGMLAELLSPNSLRDRGFFEPAAVQRLIHANDTGKVDASYSLLSLLCIEIWCRRYLDAQPVPAGNDPHHVAVRA